MHHKSSPKFLIPVHFFSNFIFRFFYHYLQAHSTTTATTHLYSLSQN